MTRVILFLTTFTALCSFAQAVCPQDPAPRRSMSRCMLKKDPVSIGSRTTFLAPVDFTINTGVGPFEFKRYYSSSSLTARPTIASGLIWPNFGPGMFGPGTSTWNPASPPQWSHELFSFVFVASSSLHVFDGNMAWTEYSSAKVSGTSPGCYVFARTNLAPSETERLENMDCGTSGVTQGPFRRIRDDGQQWIYNASNGAGTRWFVSEVRHSDGRPFYRVNYSAPANCMSIDGAFPYISSVDFASGESLDFRYQNQQPGQECLVSSIEWRSASTAPTSIATYSYISNVLSAAGGALQELYSFDAINRDVRLLQSQSDLPAPNSVLKSRHVVDPVAIEKTVSVTPVPGGPATTADAVSAGLPSANVCLPIGSATFTKEIVATEPAGLPNATTQTVTTRYTLAQDAYAGSHSLRLVKEERICSGSGPCANGLRTYLPVGVTASQVCDATNIVGSTAVQDERGNWSSSTATTGAVNTFGMAYLTVSRIGETSPGVGALETVNFPPPITVPATSSSGSLQFPAPVAYAQGRDGISIVDGSTVTSTRSSYSPTGYLIAERETGVTATLNGNVVRTRLVTYRQGRSCADVAVDPVGRTLHIEGPCWESATYPGFCESTNFPVTEFSYYSSTDSYYRAGRLKSVTRYPSAAAGNCGNGLTTVIMDYTPEGLPTEIVRESGETIYFGYRGRSVVWSRLQAGGPITNYKYESNGELAAIEYPDGSREDWCWRAMGPRGAAVCEYQYQVPGGAWATTPLTKKPRFHRRGTPGTLGFLQEFYTYDSAFNLIAVAYDDADLVTRMYRTSGFDSAGRETWSGQGVTPVLSVATKRRFDAVGNLVNIGLAGSNAPDLCSSGTSPLCAALDYDRADRLTRVTQNVTGTAGGPTTTTCFDYDGKGNVRRQLPGCTSPSACVQNSSSGAMSSCAGSSPTDYDYDDFGNVIKTKAPWTTLATAATTQFVYDARGQVIQKQTAQMAQEGTYLEFTFDQIGRPLAAYKDGTGGRVILYSLSYDSRPAWLPSCAAAKPTTFLGGRLASRIDSSGRVAYSYSASGKIERELRFGIFGFDCQPDTAYSYNSADRLLSIVYPFGRVVSYGYRPGDFLPSTVATSLLTRGLWASQTIIKDIVWWPDGGVRRFKFATGPSLTDWNSVEYLRSAIGNETSCAAMSVVPTTTDLRYQVRALWVSSGDQPLGAGNGDLLKQTYSWTGDLISEQKTCFTVLSQASPHVQGYQYDNLGRLTGSSGSNLPVRTSGSGAGVAARTYSYSTRSTRNGQTIDGCPYVMSMGSGQANDLLNVWYPDQNNAACQTGYSGYTRLYDADGRTATNATAYWWWREDFGWGNAMNLQSGLDTVFKSVSITGGVNYGVSYDAFGRRVAKALPTSQLESFYWMPESNQLLTAIADEAVSSGKGFSADDYIWLGNLPVAMIRMSLDSSKTPLTDVAPVCNRFGAPGKCGLYYLVSDVLPKPIMMVEATSRLATNAALYDEFGNVNRVPVVMQTMVGTSAGVQASMPSSTGAVIDARVLYNLYDVPSTVELKLNGVNPLSGRSKAHVWSAWSPSVGSSASVTMSGTIPPKSGYKGYQTEVIEYRRRSLGAPSMWTPLRFPGQIYDEELEFSENWNRAYDPPSGRYLSPEPLLQDPGYIRGMARQGFSTPTYAYALNNPVRYTDPDGLQVPMTWPFTWTWPTFGPPSPWTFALPALWPSEAGRGSDCSGGRCGRFAQPSSPSYLPPIRLPLSPSIPNTCSLVARKTCDEHYDACMDAHIANGWPPVYNCVECTRQCKSSGGTWPGIKESSGDRYLCDYENPWSTPSGN